MHNITPFLWLVELTTIEALIDAGVEYSQMPNGHGGYGETERKYEASYGVFNGEESGNFQEGFFGLNLSVAFGDYFGVEVGFGMVKRKK